MKEVFYMKNFLDEYSIAIVSLFAGLSSMNIFRNYPVIAEWLSYISIVILVFMILRYIVIRISNKFVPRRYANLIFMLDEDNNLAVIHHPLYNRIQPAGGRLYYNERPEDSVHRVVQKELGMSKNMYQLVSDDKSLERYGNAYLVPRPFQIQVEVGTHKFGVHEHYDFVYVCFAKGVKPKLDSELKPIWMSLDEIERFSKDNIQQAPWESIIPTYKKIIKVRKKLKYYEINEVTY